MFEFNYVRGQVRCTKQHVHALKSGYCNHVMALLYEIAKYSLNQLTEVPQEKACTSVLRKWGIPGNKEVVRESVMRTTLPNL